MKILALDLATKTGWALLANGITTSGVIGVANGMKKADDKHPGKPFASFQKWIHPIVLFERPDVIVYEEVYRWMSSHAANCYNGYRATMLAEAWMSGAYSIPCIGYSPPSIKKHFTGHGHAKKADMIAEAERRWPSLEIIDDNQVDAIAILSLHCAKHYLPEIDPS